MIKILKYSLFDWLRSWWIYGYFAFFMLLSTGLFLFSGDSSQVMISLMNIILILCPLIAIVFGVMDYYNGRDLHVLLLAQPVRRTSIFFGKYLSLAISLSLCLVTGTGIPFLIFGMFGQTILANYFMLLLCGVFLCFIFSAIAYVVAIRTENKVKGFGMAIFIWLFFAVIYDGIFLLLLMVFSDYPLENAALAGSLFNPIDLSRILILLKLDISALMGYTGAVFKAFFGTSTGILLTIIALLVWLGLPVYEIHRSVAAQDF